MCRAMKPKLHVCKDMQDCGGARTQAPKMNVGVIDLMHNAGTIHEEVRGTCWQRLEAAQSLVLKAH